MKKDKLRIGLLLDGYVISAWQYTMFEKILESNYAEIKLVVINAAPSNRPNRNLLEKIKANRGNLINAAIEKSLNLLYDLLIERRHSVRDASAKLDSEGLFSNIPALQCKPIQTKWSDRLTASDVSAIEDHQLDILVRCGFRILRGDILKIARYGVWSFHHGDNKVNRGGPAGLWESMESWPVNGSVLQILNEDLDNGLILYRSYSSTSPMAVKDNRSRNKWKTLSFMPRKMQELYDSGPEVFFSKVADENRNLTFYSNRLYVTPTNYQLAKLLGHKVLEKCERLYRDNFYQTQWILMYDIKNSFSSSLWRYKKIIPPKDRFYADPHIIQRDNTYYIFIEEFIFGSDNGFISVITMDEKGNYSKPEPVLQRPYHLSYPFVFKHGGHYYMVPETEANRTVELYKCVEFPLRWEFQMNLMQDVRAGDATLHYQDNKWWLFATMTETRGASLADELHAFSADILETTKWHPHTKNPVVSDCRNARPAGRIFEQDGQLYRPAQNSSYHYGYGFNLNEICVLNDNEYLEQTISRVEPNWDSKITGTHTFSRTGSLHMIDAIYRRRRFGRNS